MINVQAKKETDIIKAFTSMDMPCMRRQVQISCVRQCLHW